jgi:hypothetical protein
VLLRDRIFVEIRENGGLQSNFRVDGIEMVIVVHVQKAILCCLEIGSSLRLEKMEACSRTFELTVLKCINNL